MVLRKDRLEPANNSKPCSSCGRLLPLTEFSINETKRDGRNGVCRACQKVISRASYLRNKRGVLQRKAERRRERTRAMLDHLRTHPCMDCGEADPVVLEFDHVSGEKIMDVSRMARHGVSERKLRAEMEKCEIRCANCHRRRTAMQYGWKKSGSGRNRTDDARFQAEGPSASRHTPQ